VHGQLLRGYGYVLLPAVCVAEHEGLVHLGREDPTFKMCTCFREVVEALEPVMTSTSFKKHVEDYSLLEGHKFSGIHKELGTEKQGASVVDGHVSEPRASSQPSRIHARIFQGQHDSVG